MFHENIYLRTKDLHDPFFVVVAVEIVWGTSGGANKVKIFLPCLT